MLEIQLYNGRREALQALFAEADDSESEIAGYRDQGEILVALVGGETVGHIQIIPTAEQHVFEVKSLAVHEPLRSRGIGAALIEAASTYSRERHARTLVLATAAASIRALQFYQRQGFRIQRVIRDFYSPERGYRPLELNGIPLRDEVILDLTL